MKIELPAARRNLTKSVAPFWFITSIVAAYQPLLSETGSYRCLSISPFVDVCTWTSYQLSSLYVCNRTKSVPTATIWNLFDSPKLWTVPLNSFAQVGRCNNPAEHLPTRATSGEMWLSIARDGGLSKPEESQKANTARLWNGTQCTVYLHIEF